MVMGLARHPDLYQCAAAFAPVTDLYAYVASMQWMVYGAQNRVLWGDLREAGDAERLKRNSPISLAAKFSRPVLLAHGRHDAQVPASHTESMAAALEKAGRKH